MPGVTIVDDAPVLGGAELFALRLAEWVRDTHVAPAAVCAPPETALARRCRDEGLEVVAASFPDLRPAAALRMPSALRRMRTVLAQARRAESLVVANTARAQAYVAAAQGGRGGDGVVHVLHERETAGRRSARAVLRRHGSLVAIGAGTTSLYREALGVPVSQVNNFLLPADLERAVGLREPAPGGARPRLGALGRIIPEKGFVELVDELASIPESWDGLVIAGPAQDPACTEQLTRRVGQLGVSERVQLAGEVRDLATFFAGIDALVVPSVGGESQPTVILEALAYGRPVVVRAPLGSPDYEGLPVTTYLDPGELARALASRQDPVDLDLLATRFGPEQALAGITRAAARAVDGAGPGAATGS